MSEEITGFKVPVPTINEKDITLIDNIFSWLKSTSSRKEKEEILKEYVGYEPLWYVFKAGLTPCYNYYNVFEHLLPEKECSKVVGQELQVIIEQLKTEINLQSDYGILCFSGLYYGLNGPARRILKGIVSKDFGVGVGPKTLNKIRSKAIPIVPYMRCSLPKQSPLEKLDWAKGVLVQEKCDGMFLNMNTTKPGQVDFYSRSGSIIDGTKLFDEVQREVLSYALPPESQTHGEVLIVRETDHKVLPREEGNGILNTIIQGGDMPSGYHARVVVWDTVPLYFTTEAKEYKAPYSQRFATLLTKYRSALAYASEQTELARKCEDFITFDSCLIDTLKIVPTKRVYSINEAKDFYRELIQQGKEGAVVKTLDGTWKDGTSKHQIKLKIEADCDLKIVSYEEGKGKYEGLVGSVVCHSSDDLLEVSVSGFSDAIREMLSANRDGFIGSIVTVKFNNVMAPKEDEEKHSLFLPRWVELREDKTMADSLERVKEQFQSVIDNA